MQTTACTAIASTLKCSVEAVRAAAVICRFPVYGNLICLPSGKREPLADLIREIDLAEAMLEAQRRRRENLPSR